MKSFKLVDRSNRGKDSLSVTVLVRGGDSSSFSVLTSLTTKQVRDLIMKGEFKVSEDEG